VENWERKEIQRASCCSDNEQRALEAERKLKEAKSALDDFLGIGVRADLNPTQPMGDWEEVSRFYLQYLKSIDDSVRDRARQALKEIGEDR
jgi:hypothetical protein